MDNDHPNGRFPMSDRKVIVTDSPKAETIITNILSLY
jgi:hypothetical protein